MRDAVRRDLEVGLQSLSFLERFGEGLDSQRRLFVDFPRVTEELRTGAMERLASSMEHLYEGTQGSLDLARFLRDLPLALGHLAQAEFAAHRQKQQQAAAAAKRAAGSANATFAPAAEAADGTTSEPADQTGDGPAAGESTSAEETHASADASGGAHESSGAATGAGESDSAAATPAPEAEAAKPAGAEAAKPDISPRVELRTRLLAAAPNLGKAAAAFRRNAGTVRRAAAPRRAVGPWRSDKEVLEQARRAIEFANKVYDAYAEAWNDAPLAKNAGPEAAAEMDRFLAWTQLSRYADVARTQSSGSPSAKTHEAAPGVKSEKQSHSQPPPAKSEAETTQAPPETTTAAPVETTTSAPA